MPTLFDPLEVGDLKLPNRLVMAPLTGCRASGGRVPNALMSEYYAQRETAYASSRSATPPEDLLKELSKNKKAEAFFKTLNKTNVYSIVYRLETAKKPETREKRMKTILAMMEQGKAFHP
jgi:uncharacterized protein YdeI (YjbR/CyaY-like superfamily)